MANVILGPRYAHFYHYVHPVLLMLCTLVLRPRFSAELHSWLFAQNHPVSSTDLRLMCTKSPRGAIPAAALVAERCQVYTAMPACANEYVGIDGQLKHQHNVVHNVNALFAHRTCLANTGADSFRCINGSDNRCVASCTRPPTLPNGIPAAQCWLAVKLSISSCRCRSSCRAGTSNGPPPSGDQQTC